MLDKVILLNININNNMGNKICVPDGCYKGNTPEDNNS